MLLRRLSPHTPPGLPEAELLHRRASAIRAKALGPESIVGD